MPYLLRGLRRYKLESILAPLFKMLEALFDLFVPVIMASIINQGIAARDTQYILQRCGLLVLLAVIGTSCSLTAQYFAAKAAVGCTTDLRHRLFAHIQTLDAAQRDTIGTNTLITRLTSDLQQVQNGLNMFLRLFLRSPFIVFGSLFFAFHISTKAGIIFAIVVPVLFVIVFGLMAWTSPRYKEIQSKLDTVLGLTRENLTGVRVVRAFNQQTAEVQQFAQANADLTQSQLHVGHVASLLNPFTSIVIHLGMIAVLSTGAVQVQVGSLRAGDVIALIDYLSQILVELVKMANTIVLTSKGIACMQRVAAVLDTSPEMDFPAEDTTPVPTKTAVEFHHVSFTYAGAGDASLTDISFSAFAGQTIGIIGSTGSGKTSLINLLSRFYDATSGTIQLFGLPIGAFSAQNLHQRIAIVPQKAQLFSGTIRSNLLWGNPNADDAALWAALEIAQAADFVKEKPFGLDEPITQGGRNLSGGQRQRLTIARALVQNPDILILDDSFSALDFATDAALRHALAQSNAQRTIFVVSQRAASLQRADKILVLEDGQLVGCGTHTQLLTNCPTYQEICRSQSAQGGPAHA